MLHVVLSTMASGRAFRTCYEVKSQDGKDTLRKLAQEYMPKLCARSVALLNRVMPADFAKAKDNSEYLERLQGSRGATALRQPRADRFRRSL